MPYSILVADDDPAVRQCLSHVVHADPQLEVRWEAANGLQALVLATQHHPDVVLIDSQMPRMDGIETTRLIRQRGIECCIVILSVHDQTRQLALEAGADAFVVKDCGCELLRDLLKQLIKTQHIN